MRSICISADWSIPKPRWGLVRIEGEFYERTTTAEGNEDRTVVPSVVKTESELCVCTERVSMFHTDI